MVRINPKTFIITSILFFTAMCPSAFGIIIYVDDDATGTNDGSSWVNAYLYLQDALADANTAEKLVEIRVAQGIYRPDQGVNQIPGDREATFKLINGVTLKGGYAGFGEPDPNARDFDACETILSGDLNGDDTQLLELLDLLYESTRAENSYHVITAICIDDTTVLDGFNITAGNANGPESADSNSGGAGLYNFRSCPTVINCVFTGNSARWSGAGMHNINSNPLVINCTFNKNSAGTSSGGHGGGMSNNPGSNPVLTNCKFSNNWAGQGGGINALCCAPIANHCKFIDNSANFGGGVQYKDSIDPEFSGCTFSDNSAHRGAAAQFIKSSPILTNCLFTGNSAGSYGGAIAFTNMSISTLSNCTFAANSAPQGCALACDHVWYGTSNIYIMNSIFWNGENETWNKDGSIMDINYSNIHGDIACVFDPCDAVNWGEGNIFQNPLFADPNDGDYHLKSEVGRWDPVSENWVVDDVTSPCIDAGDPNTPVGDETEPNGGIINMGAYGGTAEASMSPAGAEQVVYVQWLGHSTVKVWTDDCIVYVDPERVPESLHDATLVCVTHTHGDHYSPSDIAKVSNAETQFIAPPDVIQLYGSGQTIAPGQTIEFDFVTVKAVPAYNINKSNHPKSNNWVGYIIELGGKRIYVAGDTDLIEEMKTLGDIDVAFLPAGGTYTMNSTEAAEATEYIKPDLAIPYHWGQSVGTLADAQRFAELARCPAKVLAVGEMISSDNWPVYSPLIAYWALDEAEGDIAHDIAGENHGTLFGEPAWQPVGGKKDGALQLDGIDDYISTNFVLNPADGAFSVFAWIKGGDPGQAVISQTDGTGAGETWLGADPLDGKLMTSLVPPPAGRFVPQPLVSESIITDGQWHHVGFAWDGSYRILYVDGTEIAKDTAAQKPLKHADGGMYIGADKNLDPVTFLSGLIDDVRIYNLALSAEELDELAQ